MNRKATLALLSLFACLAIVAGIGIGVFANPENRTIRYFRNHRAALEADISNTAETGRASSSLDIPFNYWDGEHPIVEYIVVGRGLGSASRYYGFFYSFDDEPVAFQNAGAPLTPVSAQEWTWRGEGDNRGSVRRLDANWFYFEAEL